MSNIINLTPDEVVVVDSNGEVIRRFPASGNIARLGATRAKKIGNLDGIPITRALSNVVGLPEAKEGTYYIVSLQVAQGARDRKDLLVVADDIPKVGFGDSEVCASFIAGV